MRQKPVFTAIRMLSAAQSLSAGLADAIQMGFAAQEDCAVGERITGERAGVAAQAVAGKFLVLIISGDNDSRAELVLKVYASLGGNRRGGVIPFEPLFP